MYSKPKTLPITEWKKNIFVSSDIVKIVQSLLSFLSSFLFPIFWGRLKIHGLKDDLPLLFKKKGLIIIANHKSYFDPLIVSNVLSFKPIYFFSKDELFLSRLSKLFFTFSGAFPSFYGSGLDNSLRIPSKLLKDGQRLVIFPEGRCIRNESLGEPKVGIGALLLKFPDTMILSLSIRNSYKIKWRMPWSLPTIDVKIGMPFKVNIEDKTTPEEIARIVMDNISKLYYS